QTLREALDRPDHRDAENREGDEHLEQREPTLAARGWRGRVSAPGSGHPSSTTTALESAASGPTRCGVRALTTRVSEGGRRARRGRAFPPTRLAPRSGHHTRAARQDPPHPAHSRTLRTRPVAAATVPRQVVPPELRRNAPPLAVPPGPTRTRSAPGGAGSM